MAKKNNYFEKLNAINVNDHVEKKNGLTYLSWAWAWAELKKMYPESFYTIYENKDGLFYHTDGVTAWVKTGVTVKAGEHEIEHIEYLPVMDYKNKSIPLANITSFDVNKTIQRSLTKAVARHGLGLYIYAGEDLPEDDTTTPETKPEAKTATKPTTAAPKSTTTAKPKKAANKVRAEFVAYCKDNGIEGEELITICKMFKLNNDSPDESFSNALEYCKGIVRKRDYAEALASGSPDNEPISEYPEEV